MKTQPASKTTKPQNDHKIAARVQRRNAMAAFEPMPGERDQDYLPMHGQGAHPSSPSGFGRFGW